MAEAADISYKVFTAIRFFYSRDRPSVTTLLQCHDAGSFSARYTFQRFFVQIVIEDPEVAVYQKMLLILFFRPKDYGSWDRYGSFFYQEPALTNFSGPGSSSSFYWIASCIEIGWKSPVCYRITKAGKY